MAPVDHLPPAVFSHSTDEGFVIYRRTGQQVNFRLNYRDQPQTAQLPDRSRAVVTNVVDGMRDKAVAAMRETIGRLQQGLLDAMPEDSEQGEVLDPEMSEWPFQPEITRNGDLVTVSLPPFVGELSDSQPGTASDRLLVGEYCRAMTRMRVGHLWAKYDQARLDLIAAAEI